MTVTFFIKEDIKEVISNLQSERWTVEQYPAAIGGVEYSHRMVDIDWPDCWANFTILEDSVIRIRTAWSGYEYTISRTFQGCMVEYKGAYMGLLEQELLPNMTPKDILEAEVKSTFLNPVKDNTIEDYVFVRRAIYELKKKTMGHVGHIHPRCVTEAMKPN